MKLIPLALLVAMAAGSDAPRIRVSPQSFMAGATVTVTCTVPRRDTNRLLTVVLDGYTRSDRDLDGERAPITHRFEFKHVPCGVERAACIVTDAYTNSREALTPLTVAGCEP